MRSKFLAMTALAAGLVLGMAAPAFADTVLVANNGWQNDQINLANTPSVGSDFVFTVAHGFNGSFAVTDAFIPGDTYSVFLFGSPRGSSVFANFGNGYFDNSLGDQTLAAAWSSSSYSHYIILFGEGNFSFTVTGDGIAGLPAGLGVRFDTHAVGGGVPEPATWALMLGGFGLAGAALRRRRATAAMA